MGIPVILDKFIARECLPDNYRRQAQQWLLPLAEELAEAVATGTIRVVGISGSQGSGKSTLAALLQTVLPQQFNFTVINFSIDDFYLTRAEREQLAEAIHPLFVTRGVPGTHDIALARDTINALTRGSGPVPLPRFDKARDDRVPASQWQTVNAPVDLVILEGWCLKIPPQAPAQLEPAINVLEQQEDKNGTWRRYANDRLKQDYPLLFNLIDYLIFLRAPDFESICGWRRMQEEKLAQQPGNQNASGIMDKTALNRFMQHYERLTRHGLNTLGAIADTEFILDRQQMIVARNDKTGFQYDSNPPR